MTDFWNSTGIREALGWPTGNGDALALAWPAGAVVVVAVEGSGAGLVIPSGAARSRAPAAAVCDGWGEMRIRTRVGEHRPSSGSLLFSWHVRRGWLRVRGRRLLLIWWVGAVGKSVVCGVRGGGPPGGQ